MLKDSKHDFKDNFFSKMTYYSVLKIVLNNKQSLVPFLLL